MPPARPPRALSFGLLLLSFPCATARAETWPTRLGESDKVCLAALREADSVARNPRPEARKGLWELLRATLDACDRPEVDARFAARAVRLAMILPEYSSPLKQIPALEEAARRLEALSEPPPELVRTLDEVAGRLCQVGRHSEARTLFNRLLDLRKGVFGERSLEAALGWINLAHFHASKDCGEQPHGEDLSRFAAMEAVKLVAERPDCGEDYFRILGAYAGVLDSLGKHEASSELGQLFLQIEEAARASSESPAIQRWDEPLPEP